MLFFSFMADETTNVANHEEIVLVFRWFDKDLSIHEDFVELRHIPDTEGSRAFCKVKI